MLSLLQQVSILHFLKAAMGGLLLVAYEPPLKSQHDPSHPPHHPSCTWLSGAICPKPALSLFAVFGLFQPFSLKFLSSLHNIKKGFCSVLFPNSSHEQECGSFFFLLLPLPSGHWRPWPGVSRDTTLSPTVPVIVFTDFILDQCLRVSPCSSFSPTATQ